MNMLLQIMLVAISNGIKYIKNKCIDGQKFQCNVKKSDIANKLGLKVNCKNLLLS